MGGEGWAGAKLTMTISGNWILLVFDMRQNEKKKKNCESYWQNDNKETVDILDVVSSSILRQFVGKF